jgi:hypothetical protein
MTDQWPTAADEESMLATCRHDAAEYMRDLIRRVRDMEQQVACNSYDVDERNAGANAFASMLLTGANGGCLSPGPCADVLAEWRRTRRWWRRQSNHLCSSTIQVQRMSIKHQKPREICVPLSSRRGKWEGVDDAAMVD